MNECHGEFNVYIPTPPEAPTTRTSLEDEDEEGVFCCVSSSLTLRAFWGSVETAFA